MEPPPVQFARTKQGLSIAYSATGAGRPLVIWGPALGGMALWWHFAPEWMAGLAARFRVLQHDPPGHGMSERGLPADFGPRGDEPALDAVLDQLHFDRFILVGLHGFGRLGIRYAAANPERVEALVLISTTVAHAMPSLYRGVAAENWEFFLHSLIPESAGPEEARIWFEDLKQSTTYEDWQIRGRLSTAPESSVEADLPRLRVPTLVLHPQESPLSSSEGGRKLAALIPNARLVMISGDHPLGDAAEGLAAIDQFLAEMAPDPQQETGLPSNGLSPREIDVLRLLAAGRSNQQIADELVISLNTARRHVSNIYDKTGVANRTEASVYARDHGIA